jgi:hypothetical protein
VNPSTAQRKGIRRAQQAGGALMANATADTRKKKSAAASAASKGAGVQHALAQVP